MELIKPLELELSLELDGSGRRVRTQPRSVDTGRSADGLDNRPERRTIHIHDRIVEIRVVEKIEEACTDGELRTFPLRYAKALLDGKISVEVSWAAVLVSPGVSEIVDRVSKLRIRRAGS